jgi:hypothetical protein
MSLQEAPKDTFVPPVWSIGLASEDSATNPSRNKSQYFTKVGGISDFWGVWRAYARHTPQKSGFFKMFRELLKVLSCQVTL